MVGLATAAKEKGVLAWVTIGFYPYSCRLIFVNRATIGFLSKQNGPSSLRIHQFLSFSILLMLYSHLQGSPMKEVAVTSVVLCAKLACTFASRSCRVWPGTQQKLLRFYLDFISKHGTSSVHCNLVRFFFSASDFDVVFKLGHKMDREFLVTLCYITTLLDGMSKTFWNRWGVQLQRFIGANQHIQNSKNCVSRTQGIILITKGHQKCQLTTAKFTEVFFQVQFWGC